MGNFRLFKELKRRNVLRAAVLFIGAVWALSQGISQLSGPLHLPDWVTVWFLIACAIAFPFWIAFAWFYEFTPTGLKRESEIDPADSIAHHTGRKLDKWIIAVLAVAVVLLLTNTFVWRRGAGLHPSATDAVDALANIPAKSIAVLPFVNMSGDPKNDYFSDGITEEILNALAQVPGLKVAARTSAFAFKGKAEDLRKVGDILGVATVLEGSVQKSGDDVRITAQLIDTRSGYHLWSEKYDRKLTNIFAVEDEISKAIADKLQVQLAGGSGSTLVAQMTSDPRAHDFYLRGLTLLAARSVAEAIDAFQRAVAIDPNYAQAWAALAEAEALLPEYQLGEVQAANARSLAAAQRALALDPDNSLAYVTQGMVYTNQMRWADADRAFRRALVLAPGDAEAMDQYAQFLFGVGQLEAGLAEIERALQRDPLSGVGGAVRAENLLAFHRNDEALAQIEGTLATHPDNLLAHRVASLIYIALQHYPQAEAQMRWIGENLGNGSVAGPLLVRGIADPSLRARAVQELEISPALAGIRRDAIVHALFLARLGERERALALLEGFAFNGDSTTPELLWGPSFDPIRNDPRFKAVLKKVGLPYKPVEDVHG